MSHRRWRVFWIITLNERKELDGENWATKSPRPPINTEGTRASEMICSRGTTPIVTNCNNASSSQLCDEGFVTTFTGSLAAWEPATCPTCLSLRKGFLRSAAHDAVLRRCILSELPPIIGSLLVTCLILCSLNAGQSHYVVVIYNNNRWLAKCQFYLPLPNSFHTIVMAQT